MFTNRSVEAGDGVHALEELRVVVAGLSGDVHRTVHVLQRLCMLLNLVEMMFERVILKNRICDILDPFSSLLDNIEAVLCVVVDIYWSVNLLQSVQVFAYHIKVMFVVLIQANGVGDVFQPLEILNELRVLMPGVLVKVNWTCYMAII